MLVLHRSIEQVRTVGNSLSVQLICLRHTPVASLQGLSEALDEAGIDSPLSLQESGLLPQERRSGTSTLSKQTRTQYTCCTCNLLTW